MVVDGTNTLQIHVSHVTLYVIICDHIIVTFYYKSQ